MSITAAGFKQSSRPSGRRPVIAALAISVALNLCFVGGALWTRFKPPETITASEHYRNLEAALNLTDQQRIAFEAYVAASRARITQLRSEIEPLLDSAWAEIGNPQPDEAVILQRLTDASSRWRASQREAVDATLTLLATLNPDQRAKFLADEHERRVAARRRRIDESR